MGKYQKAKNTFLAEKVLKIIKQKDIKQSNQVTKKNQREDG